jgi:hypothetical protein
VNRYRFASSRYAFALIAIAATVLTLVLMVEAPAKVESSPAVRAGFAASKLPPGPPAHIALDPPSARIVEQFGQGDRIDLDCLVLGAWRLRGDSTD